MIDLALCLRAQSQCMNAFKSVQPRYAPRYSRTETPQGGFQFSQRSWSEVISGRTYYASLGWMSSDEYFAWKGVA